MCICVCIVCILVHFYFPTWISRTTFTTAHHLFPFDLISRTFCPHGPPPPRPFIFVLPLCLVAASSSSSYQYTLSSSPPIQPPHCSEQLTQILHCQPHRFTSLTFIHTHVLCFAAAKFHSQSLVLVLVLGVLVCSTS